MSLLEITGLTHAFGGQPLFQNAAFALHRGEHVGVVGRNGAGKSTLLKLCTGQLVPDGGRIVWQGGIRVGCLDQYAALNPEHTMGEVLHGAFRALYALERAMTELYDRAAEGDGAALAAAARRQEELEARGFYEVDTRVEKAAAGLGLAELGLDRPVGELSGGQRAKLLLARLLLEEPDVLLLDEPTNFLDQEQAAWLADTLTGLERAFLAVSHDAAFLNRAVTAVCAVEGRRLTKYPGNYAAYQAKKECLEGEHLRQYTAQQREIARTEAYIRKNRAGRNAKMARGRQKRLDRLERLGEGRSAPPVFEFQPLPAGRTGDLEVVGLSVGYRSPVLEGLDLSVHAGQKVVLTGFNGVGKSTLLNTLAGRLPPLAGRFRFSEQAALGYFPQALAWTDGGAGDRRLSRPGPAGGPEGAGPVRRPAGARPPGRGDAERRRAGPGQAVPAHPAALQLSPAGRAHQPPGQGGQGGPGPGAGPVPGHGASGVPRGGLLPGLGAARGGNRGKGAIAFFRPLW